MGNNRQDRAYIHSYMLSFARRKRRKTMAEYYDVDSYMASENMQKCVLFDENGMDFTKIYCNCGRFVDIDSKALLLKQILHKPIECSHCRNLRIFRELSIFDEACDPETQAAS